jgi:hypothetical protein
VWKKLKEIVDQHFPEISRGVGEREVNLERLGNTIQAYWDMIPKEFFDTLYQSIPRRIKAYYQAKG